jgi:dinuclear metal center YbgI/SA1388 family protein
MTLHRIVDFTDNLLDVSAFSDYALNGLQVEGKKNVRKIVTGVSANQALFEQAIDAKADLILVHHGLFWHKADNRPVQLMRKRLDILFQHNISLLAYHLPLDFHLSYGNNIQFAKALDFRFERTCTDKMTGLVLSLGKLNKTMEGHALADWLMRRLSRQPFYIAGKVKKIHNIAWCVGGAPGGLYQAAKQGADAYITGEASEPVVAMAREMGVHFYAAGHHATEMFGVQALGEHLALEFDLEHQFINIDNPI